MIRPSIAPVRPKALNEPEFEKSFAATNTDGLIVKTRTEAEDVFPMKMPNNSEPTPNILVQLEKRARMGIFQPDKYKLFAKFKEFSEQLIHPFMNQNRQDLSLLKCEISDLKADLVSLLQKNRLEIEQSLKSIIAKVVSSPLPQPESSGTTKVLQQRLDVIEDKFSKAERHHTQALEKAYQQIKQLTTCMTALTVRVETLEVHQCLRDGNQEQIKIGRGISEIKECVGSRISCQQLQPDSIASEYQQSITRNTNFLSEIKVPSVIRKFQAEEAGSQMLILDDEDDATDIRGMPIVDKNGNFVILNLRQIKAALEKKPNLSQQ